MVIKSMISLFGIFAISVSAHGLVPYFWADGKFYDSFNPQHYDMIKNGSGTPPNVPGWYAENPDGGFISPSAYGTSDIICHKNAAPGKSHAVVRAGGTIKFAWVPGWYESHKGPVLTYMAKCNGTCESADNSKNSLRWVKIDEAGINYTTQKWAAETLIANNSTWTVTVPPRIAPGHYVFRHEIIALHAAGVRNGAQNYPQCINVQVTGSGTENPTGTLGTALYKDNDPGILIYLFAVVFTNYVMPGPALYK